ncbi:hypothetical protein VARIO8X_60311 [Burkholderiales bacterium 8X]|nr:hypothetical protein VARIO8X_60311 [Burkholderiales bacterium 8X]
MSQSSPPSNPPDDGSAAPLTGEQAERDPEQEAIETDRGREFLHAGSGNSLGDGRTAGGGGNMAARDALPSTNSEDRTGPQDRPQQSAASDLEPHRRRELADADGPESDAVLSTDDEISNRIDSRRVGADNDSNRPKAEPPPHLSPDPRGGRR